MAQVINTNVASLNSQRQLAKSQSALNQSLERLSSGLRINSAKDDAAGLAISDRMTAQINGLNQAARNANDGISLAQTAEGGLNSIGDNLQRLRALAVQSANSSNSASDRAAINSEAKTLLAEISRVSGATQFNGTNLLDGTFSASQFQIGANANQTISMNIGGASTSQIGAYQAQGATVTTGAFTGSDLVITAEGSTNAATIGKSVQSGSDGSNLITADSAAAKALAINAQTSVSGVTATAKTELVSTVAPIAGSTLATGKLTINGVGIGAVTGNTAIEQGASAAKAINAQTSLHGVTAAADATTGALTLTAADGRNIIIGAANGADATDVYNATGLAAFAAGDGPTGNNTNAVTIAQTTDHFGAADALGNGSTIKAGGVTYEFNTIEGSVASGNVWVKVATSSATTGDTVTQLATALAAAVNTQNGLGNTSLTATAAAGVVTFTNTKLGDNDIASGITATVAAGFTGTMTKEATDGATGTSVVDGDTADQSTYGTLKLSSATGFSITGTDAVKAGLSESSATLTELSTIDLSTVEGSNDAISILDGAISQVDTMRADLGASQNRFTSVVSNLTTSSENLSASRSRIQDADFAAETAIMSKNNILQQAGTAMLAQANSLPQQVLSLLK